MFFSELLIVEITDSKKLLKYSLQIILQHLQFHNEVDIDIPRSRNLWTFHH